MEDKNVKSENKIMKRVFAAILAGVLALMYILTLIFAITDNPQTMSFFKASIALTIIVPVLIYAYQLVYRVINLMNKNSDQDNK